MGFKSDHFFKKVDENLHCAICHDVFDNPLSCQDGHTFCSECIEKWLQRKKKCPADNSPLDKETLVRNLTVRGIIDNLDMYCNPLCAQKAGSRPPKRIKVERRPSDELHCHWIGKLQDLQTHCETCGFQQVTCQFENCNQEMKRKELEKHKETCKYRTVVCEECAACVVDCKLQEHLENDCPNAMVPCPNNCSTDGEVTKIRRKDIADHLSDICPKVQVNCPYKEQGCGVKVERRDVNKHVQENMAGHMMLLAKECSLLRKQNKSLTDECSSLVSKNKENEEVKKELKSLTDQCSMLTRKNAELQERGRIFEELFRRELLRSTSYTWTVNDYPNLSKNYPSGSPILSPTFWLCGYRWHLLLYQTGCNEDQTGFLSLYLHQKQDLQINTIPNISSNESSVNYRLTVISQTPGTEHVSYQAKNVFSEKVSNWGWPKFMKACDAFSPSYCSNGRLTIQCTIQLDCRV